MRLSARGHLELVWRTPCSVGPLSRLVGRPEPWQMPRVPGCSGLSSNPRLPQAQLTGSCGLGSGCSKVVIGFSSPERRDEMRPSVPQWSEHSLAEWPRTPGGGTSGSYEPGMPLPWGPPCTRAGTPLSLEWRGC